MAKKTLIAAAALATLAPGITRADDVQMGITTYAALLAYGNNCAKAHGELDREDQIDIASYARVLGYDHKDRDQHALVIRTAARLGNALLNDLGEPDPERCLRSKISARSLAQTIRSKVKP